MKYTAPKIPCSQQPRIANSRLTVIALVALALLMLTFRVPQASQEKTCPPLTQGFWKNHTSAWKNAGGGLTLGTTFYTNAQLLSIFQTPVSGDASLILAHQLIAALLNIANGTDPSPVSATIADANALLGAGPIPEHIKPSSTLGQKMVSDAAILDNYNNGLLTQACAPIVPPGACLPTSSIGLLILGANVTAYVPNGSWSSGATGLQVVPLEPTGTPVGIATPNVVNSCSSNSLTGVTVCTANNTDVYKITGSTVGSTLTSGATGTAVFSGGTCMNCGVTVDSASNQAVLAIGLGSGTGYQFLNLATNTFAAPIPAGGGSFGGVSEDISFDPIRHLLLSPNESGNYQIVNTSSATPALFNNSVGGELDSAAEDCTTQIALSTVEFTNTLFIADLSQAVFTPGAPGTWTAPSMFQTFPEFTPMGAGTSGIAVAPGSHLGIVTGEFGGNRIGAIQLPSTSGSGTPSVVDWAAVDLPNDPAGNPFVTGCDPHTVTAYVSPNTGKAIAVVATTGTSVCGQPTYLAIIDLQALLAAPRAVGTHLVSALPAGVVTFVKTTP